MSTRRAALDDLLARTHNPQTHAAAAKPERLVWIDVTNHQGIRGFRLILPIATLWGANTWHKEEQWLLVAFDFDREALREYAHASIHAWRPYAADPTEEEARLGAALDRLGPGPGRD